MRSIGLLLGIVGFAATWAFFTYLVLFLGNLPRRSAPWLSVTADVGETALTSSHLAAAVFNLFLIALFALQHSGMARPGFKARLAQRIPIQIERPLYVLCACAAGFLLLLLWQPIPIVVWQFEHQAVRALLWSGFAAGWLILLLAALSIDITELLGLKQALAFFHRRPPPTLELKTAWLYRWLAHPMYVGVLLGFWCTPFMTIGHLLLAAGMTLYIVVGMTLEERDLARRHGVRYRAWRGAPLRPASTILLDARLRHLGEALRSAYAPVHAPMPAIDRGLAVLSS